MMTSIWSLLDYYLREEDTDLRLYLLLPQDMENLALIAMQTTEAFIGTKITLRATIAHLCAADGGMMIHYVGGSFLALSDACVLLTCLKCMNAFTATMGLFSETIIHESFSNPQFPGLSSVIARDLIGMKSDGDKLYFASVNGNISAQVDPILIGCPLRRHSRPSQQYHESHNLI